MEECCVSRVVDGKEILRLIELNQEMKERILQRTVLSEYVAKICKYASNFVLKDNGEEKAFVSIYVNDFSSKRAYITAIFCLSTEVRKGYGGKIIRYVINYAKESGMTKVRLEVDCDNTAAFNLYAKLGFTVVSKADSRFIMEIDI